MQTVINKTACFGTGIRTLIVFFTSMLPFLECKGAILLGAGLKLNWFRCWVSTGIGSWLVVPPLLHRKKALPRPIEAMTVKARIKHPRAAAFLQSHGCVGLLVLISVPFTGVGCWLGALTARLLHLQPRKAGAAILVGNVIASLITVLCVYGILTGIRLLT